VFTFVLIWLVPRGWVEISLASMQDKIGKTALPKWQLSHSLRPLRQTPGAKCQCLCCRKHLPTPRISVVEQRVNGNRVDNYANMSYSSRPLPSHLRQQSTSNSASTGQSPILLARINEKKKELEDLKQLRDLSAALAGQMSGLEEKLATLSNGTEGISLSGACTIL
jgi:hypothetical protein